MTCLFADLVGFTTRAESLDPEDVEAILRPYHERLRSELERHGGTVLGSTRAEVQHWEVDPRAATARVVRSTHRQLHPMAARLDVRQLAAEVAALILSGANDDRL